MLDSLALQLHLEILNNQHMDYTKVQMLAEP